MDKVSKEIYGFESFNFALFEYFLLLASINILPK